jgi:small GTP-binding protein
MADPFRKADPMTVLQDFLKGKVVFVGDAGVGKTSLINAYRNLTGPVSTTIAALSVVVKAECSRGTAALTVCDTAGHDDYRCLVPLYARGAHVAVVVYAEDSLLSFDHVPQWVDYLSSSASIPYTVLVGNKSDLPAEVPADRSAAFADAAGMTLIRTSAKTKQNVDVLFSEIAEIVERPCATQQVPLLEMSGPERRDTGGCC